MGKLWVVQVRRVRHVDARIGAGGADHDSLRVPRPLEHSGVQLDVMLVLDEGLFGRIGGQVGITVEDAQDLDLGQQDQPQVG